MQKKHTHAHTHTPISPRTPVLLDQESALEETYLEAEKPKQQLGSGKHFRKLRGLEKNTLHWLVWKRE